MIVVKTTREPAWNRRGRFMLYLPPLGMVFGFTGVNNSVSMNWFACFLRYKIVLTWEELFKKIGPPMANYGEMLPWLLQQERCSERVFQKTKTAAATTVVYPPFLTIADCVTFRVLTIFPLILKNSFFSSQLSSTSKSIPSVDASMAAARSSA